MKKFLLLFALLASIQLERRKKTSQLAVGMGLQSDGFAYQVKRYMVSE